MQISAGKVVLAIAAVLAVVLFVGFLLVAVLKVWDPSIR
jgi:hypothetical protein